MGSRGAASGISLFQPFGFLFSPVILRKAKVLRRGGVCRLLSLVMSIFQERNNALGPKDGANLLVQKVWLVLRLGLVHAGPILVDRLLYSLCTNPCRGMSSCTYKSTPLAIQWGRTPRLSSDVIISTHVVREIFVCWDE